MKTHNAINVRIKRQYFAYLKNAKGQSEATVNAVAKALARFEEYNKMRDFKAFHFNQAIAFKEHLKAQRGQQSGKQLSKSTLHATLGHLKRFFQWLSGQPGYKSRLLYSDADYFNLSEKDVRIATAKREKKAPTLEQVRHVITQMPAETDVQRRNRALIAFTLLTGARDGAIASMKLKHVDLKQGCVLQDARDVQTKFGKSFTTYFFPVGDDIRAIVEAWVTYLRVEMLWGNDDPLFPATQVECNAVTSQFEATGLRRKGWSNATPIRTIFREAFGAAGLPYFNPHSFRDTVVRLGEELCQSPEDFKAWSQNLGHEKVLVTFTSYGEVAPQRQSEIMQRLAAPQPADRKIVEDVVEAVVRELQAAGPG